MLAVYRVEKLLPFEIVYLLELPRRSCLSVSFSTIRRGLRENEEVNLTSSCGVDRSRIIALGAQIFWEIFQSGLRLTLLFHLMSQRKMKNRKPSFLIPSISGIYSSKSNYNAPDFFPVLWVEKNIPIPHLSSERTHASHLCILLWSENKPAARTEESRRGGAGRTEGRLVEVCKGLGPEGEVGIVIVRLRLDALSRKLLAPFGNIFMALIIREFCVCKVKKYYLPQSLCTSLPLWNELAVSEGEKYRECLVGTPS